MGMLASLDVRVGPEIIMLISRCGLVEYEPERWLHVLSNTMNESGDFTLFLLVSNKRAKS
eukprot:3824988-Alexandrium_andersonii.AAC.1